MVSKRAFVNWNWRSADWSAELNYSNITGELSDGEDLRSIPPEKIGLFGELDFELCQLVLILCADDQSDVPTDQHQTDAYTEVSAELFHGCRRFQPAR